MFKKFLKNNQGFALILTILIISLIVTLTLQFNSSMRSHLYAAVNLRDSIKLGCIAKSGFNCALAILLEDLLEKDFDSIQEPWMVAKDLSSHSTSMFEEGRFVIEIMDHSGKIQINKLVDENGNYNNTQKDLLTRFLNSTKFGLEPEEAAMIIDSIKDWIDQDDDTDFGAENAYYQALDKPYACKNGPLDYLEELLLIRGITKELFYGREDQPGIRQYLSIYGDGKININTADPLVLMALSDQMDEDMVQNMIAYRMDEGNNLQDLQWYKQVPEMSHVAIDPHLITTVSTHFEVRSEGFKGSMHKGVRGMVERKDGSLRVLSWQIL
jgi:general secretion pathway protein K